MSPAGRQCLAAVCICPAVRRDSGRDEEDEGGEETEPDFDGEYRRCACLSGCVTPRYKEARIDR